MASYLLETVFIMTLVLVPLLFTEALPKIQLMTFLEVPPPPPPSAAAPPAVTKKLQTDTVNETLRFPSKIHKRIDMLPEEAVAPPTLMGVLGAAGVPGGERNSVLNGLIGSPPLAAFKAVTRPRVQVSQGVIQGMVLRRVQPPYPPLARQARIQGSVVLEAEISKDGSIQNLRLLAGHPMLAPSAIEAVKQWKYKPYILNGEAVEVQTTITVNFTLSGG
jgi:protein TonB